MTRLYLLILAERHSTTDSEDKPSLQDARKRKSLALAEPEMSGSKRTARTRLSRK